MGEPEPLEMEEPTLLQQAREATTLNRVCMQWCKAMQDTGQHVQKVLSFSALHLFVLRCDSYGCRHSGCTGLHSVWA